MKLMKLILIAISIAILTSFIPEVSAASTCTISATVCKGQSYVDTSTGGLLGALRCFFLDTDATLGNHVCSSTQDRATWEINTSGGCVTLYYFDVTQGATPPAVPNKVTLSVKFDNSATVIITFLSAGAEPANGSTYSFCATSTGITGASPRAGTYRIYLNPVKDNGAGGVGNYNIDSDGTATVGTIVQSAKGVLRANMLVSALVASAPPSGSQFAYGTAADELVTLTSTRQQKNGGTTTETINFDSRHASAGSILETSGTVESAAAATDTTTFVIDNTYDAASTTYDIEYNIISNAALTSLPWTTFPATGHGSGISQITTTKVRNTAQFTADPGIIISKTGATSYSTASDQVLTKLTTSGGPITTLFNKGEIVYWEGYIYNSRSQLLSRSMTFTTQDSTPTTCTTIGAVSPSSNKYSGTFTIPTSSICLAAYDLIGSSRTWKVTNTQQSHTGVASYYVSSFYYADYHAQSGTLVKDNFPTQDSTEDFTYIISSDTMHSYCHFEGVRLDNTHINTGGSAITISVTETDDVTVVDTHAFDSDTTGWTVTRNVAPVSPARTVHGHCDTAYNGNTGTDTESEFWISAFTGDKACRLLFQTTPVSNTVTRIWVHVEKSDASITPDAIPVFIVSIVNAGVWTDVNQFSGVVKNAADNTHTINGALYYQDWLPTQVEDVNVAVDCNIEGAGLHFSEALTVVGTVVYNTIEKVTNEVIGSNCTFGGIKIENGLDNGDGGGIANNGVLESGEVDNLYYSCKAEDVSLNATQYQQTFDFNTGIATLGIWVIIIALAEWRKDFFYHVLALIYGIYVIANNNLNVPYYLLVGLIIYQGYRAIAIGFSSMGRDTSKEE